MLPSIQQQSCPCSLAPPKFKPTDPLLRLFLPHLHFSDRGIVNGVDRDSPLSSRPWNQSALLR